ncbi:hypothetical protein MKX01_005364 [Papaver californicum]|nr:hypothetical protein MKX01_005364 [Papaver californicum]
MIGIIGAGVSGLLACKYVLQKGFQPIVFESQSGFGGVWTHTIQRTKLQIPRQGYLFSNFPWTFYDKEDYPNYNQLMEYLESYALHFNLLPCIKFNTEVINLDYLIQEGQDRCKVIHSMDYSAMDDCDAAEFIKGKHVTVVGSLKSHLYLPDDRPWGVSLGSLFLKRFTELMVHKPGEGLIFDILATLLSPLAASEFVDSYFKSKFPLKKHSMIPIHSFSQELSSCSVLRVPEFFYNRVEEGIIILKKSNGFSFSKESSLTMMQGHF